MVYLEAATQGLVLKYIQDIQKIKSNHFRRLNICLFREILMIQFTLKFFHITH